METIINKAIEGGYENETTRKLLDSFEKGIFAEYNAYCLVTLDPLFWQALGKKCGWKTEYIISQSVCDKCGRTDSARGSNYCYECGGKFNMKNKTFPDSVWKENALEFHELNLTEGFDKAVEWLLELIKE